MVAFQQLQLIWHLITPKSKGTDPVTHALHYTSIIFSVQFSMLFLAYNMYFLDFRPTQASLDLGMVGVASGSTAIDNGRGLAMTTLSLSQVK